MALRRELRQPISTEQFIANELELPADFKIQITRIDRTTVEFNIVEKNDQHNLLVKVRIESDYCYLFDTLRSNKASLTEKLETALRKAKNTGEAHSLVYNIPPSPQVN